MGACQSLERLDYSLKSIKRLKAGGRALVRTFFLTVVLTSSQFVISPSLAFAACSGKFSTLSKYIGSDPGEFLRVGDVSSRIQAVLGKSATQLLRNLEVSGSVGLIDCELTVEGNARHEGGEQNAILSFNIYNGATTAGILSGGKVTIFTSISSASDPAKYSYLPAHVRDWAFIATRGFNSRENPPAGVVVRQSDRALPH